MTEISFRVLRNDRQDERLLKEVIALAKSQKATLGFLPDAAFTDRINRGHLVVAVIEGQVVGYVLFDLRSSQIKLIHVCVDPQQRGENLGKRLLDFVVSNQPMARGMIAHCRRDYVGMNRFWAGSGFQPMNEKPGRALNGSTLTIWWRQLGQPDLLNDLIDFSLDLPIVVLDANVVIDLVGSNHLDRPQREISQLLRSDWMMASASFAITPRLNVELNQHEDRDERAHQMAGAQSFSLLPVILEKVQEIETEILQKVSNLELSRDPSLNSDARFLAEAIHTGADYFVTNDENLVRLTSSWIENEYTTRVTSPQQLIADISRAEQEPLYQPTVLEGIEFAIRAASELSEEQIVNAFFNSGAGEKLSEFKARYKRSLAGLDLLTINVIIGGSGAPLALVGYYVSLDNLIVSFFRVAKGKYAATLAYQLCRYMRLISLRSGCSNVVIKDPYMGSMPQQALIDDGFRRDGDSFVATPKNLVTDANSLEAGANLSPSLVRDIERESWPLVVREGITPCVVIPVRPQAAMELFDFPDNLVSRRPQLGLSRVHSYFMSTVTLGLKELPARAIWYVSADKKTAERKIFAISRIVESVILNVDDAAARFAHQGVYKKRQIQQLADGNKNVRVLTFEDTYLLRSPLSRTEIAKLKKQHGVKGNFQSIRAVPAGFFHEVLELGQISIEGN